MQASTNSSLVISCRRIRAANSVQIGNGFRLRAFFRGFVEASWVDLRKLACGTEQQDLIGDRWKPFPGVEVEKAKGDIGDDVDENTDGKAEPS